MKDKIAILTTVANFELYKKTCGLFPKDIQVYVIDGRNGMHGLDSIKYMFKKLRKLGIDWLIMADEDVIFKDVEALYNLIDYMGRGNYDISGVRDGGVVAHRNYNPFSINTFFSVMNFQSILKIYDEKDIVKHQYLIQNEFIEDVEKLPYNSDVNSLYEPYYCFYFWLRRKGKRILFLNSDMIGADRDDISNRVYSPDGSLLLIHTWYARSYNINNRHTSRINTHLQDLNFNSDSITPVVFKDVFYASKVKLYKIFKRIKLKLSLA